MRDALTLPDRGMKITMIEKSIGKISHISLGFGGYQDAQFGLSVTLSGSSWDVGDFKGFWSRNPDSSCRWTSKDKDLALLIMLYFIQDLLRDAHIDSLDKLKDKPVEVTFKDNGLQSWRILTEVL